MTVTCPVCNEPLDTEEAHTYHAEGCPLRFPDPHPSGLGPDDCEQLPWCGLDVHEMCCPTCTGQAF